MTDSPDDSPPPSSPSHTPGAPAYIVPVQRADAVVLSKDRGHALYKMLAEEAERWQAEADPERFGHYAFVIDYVTISIERWTSEQQLRERALAAGWARDERERIVRRHQLVVAAVGVVAGVIAMILQKVYTDPTLILFATVVGALFIFIAQLISLPIGQKRNEERAKDWKTLHQALLKKLEAARYE